MSFEKYTPVQPSETTKKSDREILASVITRLQEAEEAPHLSEPLRSRPAELDGGVPLHVPQHTAPKPLVHPNISEQALPTMPPLPQPPRTM